MDSVQARPSKRVKDLSSLSAQKLLVRVNFYYFIYLLLKNIYFMASNSST